MSEAKRLIDAKLNGKSVNEDYGDVDTFVQISFSGKIDTDEESSASKFNGELKALVKKYTTLGMDNSFEASYQILDSDSSAVVKAKQKL